MLNVLHIIAKKKKIFGLSAQFINNWKSYINNKNRK